MIPGLNLAIGRGQITAIAGRNGSGKSTLARLFNSLLIPTSGVIRIDGMDTRDAKHQREIRQRVGLVMAAPDNQLVANITEDEVAFGPENLGLSRDEIRQRVDASLYMVSMEDYAKNPPYLLSGGQKQRVCIAAILAMHPRYLVLDEPTSMLDTQGRQEVLKVLLKVRQQGTGIILITQHMEETLVADRIIVLNNGRIEQDAPPEKVLTQVDKLEGAGLEPLEISKIILTINQLCGADLPKDILRLEQLVKRLCHLM